MTESRNPQDKQPRDESRRGFIRGSSLLLAGALPSAPIATGAPSASRLPPVASTRELKVGLIGCGYQGIATVSDLLNATAPRALDSSAHPDNSGFSIPLRLTALADAFPDRLQQALRTLRGRHGDLVQVDGGSRFLGLSAYRDLLATDVDLVLLAAPTCFRALHFEQAIAAGKHVYAESPIAVDRSGVERFQLANDRAIATQRVVGIGLSHRQHPQYQQAVELVKGGAIGKIVSLRNHHWARNSRKFAVASSHSELETQLRNWTHYPWASGGSELEQWALTLDVANWLLQSHPLAAWCSPNDPSVDSTAPSAADAKSNPGPIADTVEFTYAAGIKLQCHGQLGHQPSSKHHGLVVHGTEGWCDLAAGAIFDSKNALLWQANDKPDVGCGNNRWESFLAAITEGKAWNQGAAAIECTLAAILGRLAVSGRKRVTWDDCLQSLEVFDCITPTIADLDVDRNVNIERYLAGWNK